MEPAKSMNLSEMLAMVESLSKKTFLNVQPASERTSWSGGEKHRAGTYSDHRKSKSKMNIKRAQRQWPQRKGREYNEGSPSGVPFPGRSCVGESRRR